ncbi:NAD(P)/FAD-dependent oxidoreductase [Alkalimonas amylolytica]|uniref:D-amino-acid dehydrogenase n=1 Tax=Alkalimonas amylolytica TaxID=152573 RepID=A0A1H4EXA4_ALKAM|nr:FAD-binding oxidoreductase [Alkalimonas amylolytica]SEA89477.1 D-amino-acid dehydrogenase [Alkalimonas amylolytica]
MQQVTVVGAGVVGLCTAFFLQHSGFSVLLVDEKAPAEGCSKGNAGHFATEQVFPLANKALLWQLPAMLLKPDGPLKIRAAHLLKSLPWFCRFIGQMGQHQQLQLQQALSHLNGGSLASWQKLASLCQSQDLIRFDGALLVTEQSNLTQLKQQYQNYRAAGIDVSLLDQASTLALEPELSRNIQGALDFTEVAHTVDPWLLCQRIFAAFQAAGGQWLQSKVLSVFPRGLIQLLTESRLIATERLVLCAGAHSANFAAQLGWKVPLAPERGYHLMAESVAINRPVSSLERKFIMTPMREGLRLAGTVEFAGLEAKPDFNRAKALFAHASHLIEKPLTAQRNAMWHGNRPSLPDSLPVLGPCPAHQGVYYNFGHQHLGLTQAAYSAELISQSMNGNLPKGKLEPYRIDRFGPYRRQKEQA